MCYSLILVCICLYDDVWVFIINIWWCAIAFDVVDVRNSLTRLQHCHTCIYWVYWIFYCVNRSIALYYDGTPHAYWHVGTLSLVISVCMHYIIISYYRIHYPIYPSLLIYTLLPTFTYTHILLHSIHQSSTLHHIQFQLIYIIILFYITIFTPNPSLINLSSLFY